MFLVMSLGFALRSKLTKPLQLIIFNKSDLVLDFEIPAGLDFVGPTLVVSASDEASVQPLVTCIVGMRHPLARSITHRKCCGVRLVM